MANEALDGESVACVVFFMEPDGFIKGKLEVLGKVLVDELCHQVLNFGAFEPPSQQPKRKGIIKRTTQTPHFESINSCRYR